MKILIILVSLILLFSCNTESDTSNLRSYEYVELNEKGNENYGFEPILLNAANDDAAVIEAGRVYLRKIYESGNADSMLHEIKGFYLFDDKENNLMKGSGSRKVTRALIDLKNEFSEKYE